MEPKKGLVVAIHPEDHSVDVVLFEDGTRLAGVQVMSTSATSNSGLADLAAPTAGMGDSRWDLTQRTGRQVHAVVGFMGREPYVQGFLFPQLCQMTFADKNRRVDRHASDFYQTIDGAANAEWYHPSGTFLRIGATPGHEDLTGKDYDGRWNIAENTDTAPYVNLTLANAGAVKCTVQIDPEGNVTVVSASGKAKFTFPGGTVFDTPDLNVTGNIKAGGDITDKKRSMQADRDIYNKHTNPNNGSSPPSQQM